jgi:hypothetical protein
MMRLVSFDLLGIEGHGDQLSDFCFLSRGDKSLWRCVVGGVGTIVVRCKLTNISLVACTTEKAGVLFFWHSSS